MNTLFYLLFLALFSLDWLAFKLELIPRFVTWIPEILSLVAMVLVIMLGVGHRTVALNGKYITFLLLFFTIIAGGVVINGVSAGTMVAGLRIYMKYLPFFLLPAVYAFSNQQITRQLKFLLVLSLLQFPLTVYQRLFKYRDAISGDVVGGSLGAHTSGTLSVYLTCAILLVVAFYLKEKINRPLFFLLVVLLSVPMTLNETKVTLLILPFALLVPAIFRPGIKQKLSSLLPLFVIGLITMVAFVQIYDYFRAPRSGTTLLEWATEPENVSKYLLKEGVTTQYHHQNELGRFDSIRLAFKYLNREGSLLMGVGIGNASPSFSEKLTGKYYKKYRRAEPTKVYIGRVLWELGLAGVLLYAYFFVLVFLDASHLRHHNGTVGAVALGWMGVVMIVAGSFTYFKTFDANIFAYLFWYLSGYIAAKRFTVNRQGKVYNAAG